MHNYFLRFVPPVVNVWWGSSIASVPEVKKEDKQAEKIQEPKKQDIIIQPQKQSISWQGYLKAHITQTKFLWKNHIYDMLVFEDNDLNKRLNDIIQKIDDTNFENTKKKQLVKQANQIALCLYIQENKEIEISEITVKKGLEKAIMEFKNIFKK